MAFQCGPQFHYRRWKEQERRQDGWRRKSPPFLGAASSPLRTLASLLAAAMCIPVCSYLKQHPNVNTKSCCPLMSDNSRQSTQSQAIRGPEKGHCWQQQSPSDSNQFLIAWSISHIFFTLNPVYRENMSRNSCHCLTRLFKTRNQQSRTIGGPEEKGRREKSNGARGESSPAREL